MSKCQFSINPGTETNEALYYSGSDQEYRCIGHLRGDFGKSGNEYWTSFWPHEGVAMAKEGYESELNKLVQFLRKDMLKSRTSMRQYIDQHPPLVLESGEMMVYGYHVMTENREYYIRCTPHPGCYDFYLYCYLRESK